jgi:hypothetical protein
MDYYVLIESIKVDINNNDLTSLEVNLTRLPLEKMNQKSLDKLLTILITQCNEYKSIISLQTILTVLYQIIPVETGQLDHLTRLFTLELQREVFKLIIDAYPDKTMTYYFNYLIQYDSSPIVMIAAKNLEQAYGLIDGDIWRYLYNLTFIYNDNPIMKDFLSTKVKETSAMIKKPDYIINDYNHVPLEADILIQPEFKPYQLPPTNAVLKLLSQFYNNDYNNNNYINADDETKRQILDPVMLSNQRLDETYNINYFKVYGPVNITLTQDLSGDDICSILGCRMLTCHEYHENTEDIDKTKWFTGACDYCFNQIPYKHWAVRRPLVTGGFLGCYCTWDCIRADTKSSQKGVQKLINIFEQQMISIGIQDRL